MEDLFSILWAVNRGPAANQREIAQSLDISVGKVNSLLKTAEEQGMLAAEKDGKRTRFTILPPGRALLEQMLLKRRQGKLRLEPSSRPVRTAVILAAGRRPDFDKPAALLPLGESTVIETEIQMLES